MAPPPPLGPQDLDALVQGGGTVVDTRDPAAFRRGHLTGSLLAPLGKHFQKAVSAYVGGGGVVLVVGEGGGEEAVREAEAAGLSVRGVVTADVLAAWGGGDRLRMLKAIDFDELDGRRHYTNVLVLDVRDREAWERKHVPGSRNIPFDELAAHLGDLPRDRTILVHCGGGLRSAIAAAFLHARGFCVAHVDDAFENWKERHLAPGAAAGTH